MSMIFVAGPIVLARQIVFKKIVYNLQSQNVFYDGIGKIEELGTNEFSKNEIVSLVENSIIENPKKDFYIFTGVGLSLCIKDIIQKYPLAVVYLLKENEDTVELEPLSESYNVNLDILKTVNQQIINNLNDLTTKFDLSWRPVDPPIIRPNNSIKYTPEGASSKTEFLVATINL